MTETGDVNDPGRDRSNAGKVVSVLDGERREKVGQERDGSGKVCERRTVETEKSDGPTGMIPTNGTKASRFFVGFR